MSDALVPLRGRWNLLARSQKNKQLSESRNQGRAEVGTKSSEQQPPSWAQIGYDFEEALNVLLRQFFRRDIVQDLILKS